MQNQQSSYRQIVKATSIFGGVSIFNILIQLIRSKIIAVLLGTSGMGILGLLNSTISLISSFTNFGLSTSAVKEIAKAHGTDDQVSIGRIGLVIRRLVWLTGLIGVFVTIVSSPWLSQFAFGTKDYTLSFIWISVTLLLNQLSTGRIAVLQGTRRLKLLAKANMTGSLLSVMATLPLYFFWGKQGIVPAIILASAVNLLITWIYSGKTGIRFGSIGFSQSLNEGRGMLKMGFLISLTGVMETVTAFLVRGFISQTGGVDDVGLFTAGFAIINGYVGLVFNSMGTDFFPRLTALSDDNPACRSQINQQAEIAILILAPILILLVVFIRFLVVLLYSSEFLGITGFIQWAALGMFFKAASWAVAFIFLAKGANKTFFWTELASAIYTLALNLLGYHYLGLTGIGLSFMLSYLIYLMHVWSIARKDYAFTFSREFKRLFAFQFMLTLAGFVVTRFLPAPFHYLSGIAILVISSWYSAMELEKRIGLKTAITEFIRQRKQKKEH